MYGTILQLISINNFNYDICCNILNISLCNNISTKFLRI